ncbi:DUF3443 domain-containing protein [Paraburkholderia sediminicola]|uniref:DUF3443 domain-containing protein n=1 Tax=Paraburkholderia sediminicola TaxID=458836 RepID=UPI0038B78729
MNTAPIVVDRTMGETNMLYVSATICLPGSQGSTQCSTVDHMLLDTGSVGVRVMASALGPTLASRLPAQTGASNDPTGGAPIAQCATFMGGYTWGSIKRADVTIGGKTAGNLPLQVIGDGAYAMPAECNSRGMIDLNTVAALGANGVIGIGHTARDFPLAAQQVLSAVYYYCPSTGSCTGTRVPLDTQVMNPVADFSSDNNGTIIRLPALPADGQTTATGELVFGVGTRQNNALPSTANIVPVDQSGFFTTVYKGITLTGVFDSGTNVYYFPDSTIPSAGVWYTPSSPLSLSAVLKASSGAGTPVAVPFSVGNGLSLRANLNAAYDNLGARLSGGFMWGLPFFFGRNVYTVLEGTKIGTQTGPFVAF